MTEKQKQAIQVLNRIKDLSGIRAEEALTEEEYFLLLEFVVGNNISGWISTPKTPDITVVPYNNPIPCYAPNGVCSNPFHDCVGCPKSLGDGSGGYFTSTTADTDVKLNKEEL